ncbi:MAG: hypothetical protein QM704_15705 [Anaeromyxobacteraceae bacterium]
MITALILAAALAAPPQYDTVTTADGTRLIGTVVEESPTKGITIQLADGSTRRLERAEVRRIEFSDGSITVWEAPAPAPAAPPAPAPAPQASPAPPAHLDTVYFAGGGRVRGRVLEEHPKDGVTIQLADGTTRHYAPEEVVRIQYGDGSTSRRRSTRFDEDRPAPQPPPAYPPPMSPPPPRPVPQPVYTMPAAEVPHHRSGIPQLVPVYGSIGAGGTWFGGSAEEGIRMDDLFHGQFHLQLEGGLRLTPAVSLGIYLEGAAGDTASPVRNSGLCGAGYDCVGTSGRIGFFAKHTWNPNAPTATWLSIGTGWEAANVSRSLSNGSDWNNDGNSSELITYRGREMLRLMGGVDYRTSPVLGFGFYGGVSWGTYDKVNDRGLFAAADNTGGEIDVPSSKVHTTVQVGLKLILFP